MSLSNFQYKQSDTSPGLKNVQIGKDRDEKLRNTGRGSIPGITSPMRQSEIDGEIHIVSDFDISEMDAQQQLFRNSIGRKPNPNQEYDYDY